MGQIDPLVGGRALRLLVVAIVLVACGRSALLDDVSMGAGSLSDAASPSGEDGLANLPSPDAASPAAGTDAPADLPSLPTCSAETCANGCCDSSNRCLAGTMQNACGAGGTRCFDCTSIQQSCVAIAGQGGACSPPSPACNPANCKGCCQGDACITNISAQACGWGGQACFACAADEICRGSCVRPQLNCGPANCDGCCGGPTICYSPGVGNIACGSGGGPCSRCVPTEGTGQCIANPNGKGGTCSTITCGPGTCAGCCSNGVCVDGSKPSSCGGGGAACQTCASGEVCSAIRTCVPPPNCSPATCSGCCGGPTGDTCIPGDSDDACGSSGFACQGCQAFRQVCVNGTCVVPVACSPGSCKGCCYGNVCAEGDQSFLCGTGGTVCQSCETSGQQCVGGACQ